MKRTRVIYAEDHDRFRQGIVEELQALQINVIAQATNGKELLKCMSLGPDVVLLDLEMPVMDGNETFDHIMSQWPDTKVIVVSLHYEELLVDDYVRRGARGYISKDLFSGAVEVLADAIQKVHRGEICVHQVPPERERFSTRQKELIPLMVNGYTNKEIAAEVGIMERSVEKQRQKIYTKLGGEKAIDFYRYAFSKGLQFLKRGK